MIDLTKPLQTVGDADHPSEPVTLISTEGRGKYPVIGYIGEMHGLSRWDREGHHIYLCASRLENVPESKCIDKHIDWSKMPYNTVVEYDNQLWWFSGVNDPQWTKLTQGYLLLMKNRLAGKKAHSDGRPAKQYEVKLVQGEWQPWFGGECPVPEGVMVSVRCRNGVPSTSTAPSDRRWRHLPIGYPDNDIIAYRIEGCAEGWTE